MSPPFWPSCTVIITSFPFDNGYFTWVPGTTPNGNVAVGYKAGTSVTTATRFVAVGYQAAASNTTGGYTTAIGYDSLKAQTTGGSNTAVGTRSMEDLTTGDVNTGVGEACMYKLTTGDYNSGFGQCMVALTSGSRNTAVGMNAGNDITTGLYNVVLGMNNTTSGNGSSQIVLGYGVQGTGDSNFTFGGSSTDSNIAFGATTITAPSDIRLKENIQDEEIGLDFINDLRPVTFQWKKEKDIPSEMKAYKEGSEERVMNGKYNHGFIAQEVKEVIDKHNLKDGFDMWTEDKSDGRQRIGDASLMPLMVKAVQELSTQVDELKSEIKTLKGE